MNRTFEDLIAAVEKRAEEIGGKELDQFQGGIYNVMASKDIFAPPISPRISDAERAAYVAWRKTKAVETLFAFLVNMATEKPRVDVQTFGLGTIPFRIRGADIGRPFNMAAAMGEAEIMAAETGVLK